VLLAIDTHKNLLLPLHKQNKRRHLYAPSANRNHDPSVRACEDCLSERSPTLIGSDVSRLWELGSRINCKVTSHTKLAFTVNSDTGLRIIHRMVTQQQIKGRYTYSLVPGIRGILLGYAKHY
jgi:hypothetical protein